MMVTLSTLPERVLLAIAPQLVKLALEYQELHVRLAKMVISSLLIPIVKLALRDAALV
jgi:hypothetical protein